jgi:hypothetical protein
MTNIIDGSAVEITRIKDSSITGLSMSKVVNSVGSAVDKQVRSLTRDLGLY